MLPPEATRPLPEIDRALAAAIDRAAWPPPTLREAMRYAALGPGKRIRPLLACHACLATGGRLEAALPAAGAIELVHAFSLVHDDLPAMDDDDLRRGRPTVHIQFDEATAILAGDSLLALAFEQLATRITPGALAATMTAELSAATGRMIAGQVRDTLGAPGDGDELATVERIHAEKTGALIRCACRLGGLAAGANENALAALTRYGERLGLLFQITDDLLDVEHSEAETGKRTGKDQPAGKLTFPAILGIEGSRRRIAELAAQAIDALHPLGPPADPLRRVVEAMATRAR